MQMIHCAHSTDKLIIGIVTTVCLCGIAFIMALFLCAANQVSGIVVIVAMSLFVGLLFVAFMLIEVLLCPRARVRSTDTDTEITDDTSIDTVATSV
jgi:hypothetical protein